MNMKNKILLIALLVVLFAGCKKEEPEAEPVAKFSYSVNDKTVTFTNQSLNAKSFYWTFGDGSATPEKSPVKNYSSAGTYTVTLKATNITKSSTYEATISLSNPTPQAKFSYSTNGLEVSFKNQSTNAQSYSWNFGNGKTSTQKDPTITYTSAGTYSVSLVASNGDKTDTYKQNVTVSEKQPVASFSYKTEHPLKVVLTNNSSNATSYLWNFGDGTTSTEKSPTHRYNGKGVYKITLTAKNNSKSNTYSTNVTIEEPTKCYLSGYVISKVPKQNEYYQIRFTDQYTLKPDNFGTTAWTLLSNANLPQTYTFSSPKQVTGFSKYWCTLWQSSKSDGSNATNAFRCEVTQNQLFTNFPETLTNTNQTSTIIEMHFIWK